MEILEIVLFSTLAGACIPIGGSLASISRIRPRWVETEFRHFVIALGGGILLGAVALVLIPEGMHTMETEVAAVPVLLAGGVAFLLLERSLGRRRWESPQLLGVLLDYIPEAMALGAMLATGSSSAFLLAILIGLQNTPEGFNAYRELLAQYNVRGKTLRFMWSLVLIGPLAGLLGYFVLADHPDLRGGIMLAASGGILYIIFQDIAPQSHLKNHWLPPLGAVLGLSITLASQLLLEQF